MKKIIFINSHPIQYFAPLYKYLQDHNLNVEVWYCSDESVKGSFDTGFNTKVKWDIPLLSGYKYKFFKNQSWKPSHFNGFWGLINLGMFKKIFTIPKSIIVVHGWQYFSMFALIMLAKIRGHVVCLHCENPLNQEKLKEGLKQKIKRVGLKNILFPGVNYFLYIGTENKAFYKSYAIPESKLIFCPYSVDNERFQNEYLVLKNSIPELKRKYGIQENNKVILCTAKYINKKRPLDILQAFKHLNTHGLYYLFMVGEGELRSAMEAYIKEHDLKNVFLTGFVNQSKISEFYSISDLFVMCSEEGETWGLSVNEALNFHLPVVVSDITGCATDLIKTGINGFLFRTGDINDLAEKIKSGLLLNKENVSYTSSIVLSEYSYHSIRKNFSFIA